MRLTERDKESPSGLSRFLTAHEDCPRGLEVLRDGSLVTVICRGCESSFAYVTAAGPHETTEVERAMADDPPRVEPAEEKEEPAHAPRAKSKVHDSAWVPPQRAIPTAVGDQGRKAVSKRGWIASPVRPTADAAASNESESPAETHSRASTETAQRLLPPGPHAPRRRRSARFDVTRRLSSLGSLLDPIAQRRRPIAMAALALTGAYVLVALGADGEQSASETVTPPGGAELPLEAEVASEGERAGTSSLADTARTLESPEAGGPNAEPFTGPGGRYSVTLSPGWSRIETERGSTRFESPDQTAAVLIRTQPSEGGLGELADRGAELLAKEGSDVERIASRSEGELLAVARTGEDGEVRTAYIADAGGVQYLVISGHSAAASALIRLEEQGIVRSFRTLPGS